MERHISRIISFGPPREFTYDGDRHDIHYLPQRGLMFGANDSHIALPDSQMHRAAYHHFLAMSQELDFGIPYPLYLPWAAEPTSPSGAENSQYYLELALAQALSIGFRSTQRSRNKASVLPYAHTDLTDSLVAQAANLGILMESEQTPREYFGNLKSLQHRGGWGRWVSEPHVQSFPEKAGIPYPVSYIGTGKNEILQAIQYVLNSGAGAVYLKPLFSSGGFTIQRVKTLEDFNRWHETREKDGSLQLFGNEMPVEVQAEIVGIEGFHSFQYVGDRIVTPGGLSEQLVDGSQWKGNIFNGTVDPQGVAFAEDIFQKYRNSGQASSMGSFDIAKTPRGYVIIEHNGARITGAHGPIAMAQKLKLADACFVTYKVPVRESADLGTLWRELSQRNMQLQMGSGGVLPLGGVYETTLLASGSDEVGARRRLDQAILALDRSGLIYA